MNFQNGKEVVALTKENEQLKLSLKKISNENKVMNDDIQVLKL